MSKGERVSFVHGDYFVDIVHQDDRDGQTIVAYTKFREIHLNAVRTGEDPQATKTYEAAKP